MKSKSKKFVCFVTGASGVGKSTLSNNLKSKYGKQDNIIILGFDTIDVLSTEEMTKVYGSPAEWQRATTKQWVAKILNEIEASIVILEGQVSFDFIHEAFDYHKFKNFKIILIDCDEEEMLRRLTQERKQPELASDEMKNWRANLRQQAKNYNAPVINTTGLTAEEVMQELEKIISLGDKAIRNM